MTSLVHFRLMYVNPKWPHWLYQGKVQRKSQCASFWLDVNYVLIFSFNPNIWTIFNILLYFCNIYYFSTFFYGWYGKLNLAQNINLTGALVDNEFIIWELNSPNYVDALMQKVNYSSLSDYPQIVKK